MKIPLFLCKCMGGCGNVHFADFPERHCMNPACFGNHLWEDQNGDGYACYGDVEDYT